MRTTSPRSIPRYFATGSESCTRGSCVSLTLYRLRRPCFSSGVSSWCFGTMVCFVMLITSSLSRNCTNVHEIRQCDDDGARYKELTLAPCQECVEVLGTVWSSATADKEHLSKGGQQGIQWHWLGRKFGRLTPTGQQCLPSAGRHEGCRWQYDDVQGWASAISISAIRTHILYPVCVLDQAPLCAGRAAELLLQDQDASVNLIFFHSLNVFL